MSVKEGVENCLLSALKEPRQTPLFLLKSCCCRCHVRFDIVYHSGIGKNKWMEKKIFKDKLVFNKK